MDAGPFWPCVWRERTGCPTPTPTLTLTLTPTLTLTQGPFGHACGASELVGAEEVVALHDHAPTLLLVVGLRVPG